MSGMLLSPQFQLVIFREPDADVPRWTGGPEQRDREPDADVPRWTGGPEQRDREPDADVPRWTGGPEQRDRDVREGAGRVAGMRHKAIKYAGRDQV